MNNNYTAIALIIDTSGSMQRIKEDTIGGIKAFIEEQKKITGKASFTLAQFNSQIDIVEDFVDIEKIDGNKIADSYIPAGGTALLDAIGITSNGLGKKLAALPEEERPSQVIVAVLTDGQENDSKKYTVECIKEIISHQEQIYNWEYLFLSSTLDALETAAAYGYGANKAIYWQHGKSRQAAQVLSDKIGSARTSDDLSALTFDSFDRQKLS